jgi:hypothetical protein
MAHRHHAQVSQSAPKPTVTGFATSHSSQSWLFGAVERDGGYGSSAVLKVASRPAMLVTVGNAARLGASQRSTTRRCASPHIATQRLSRWGSPAARARLARTVPPQAPVLRDAYRSQPEAETEEI